jgi:hypothetical protein
VALVRQDGDIGEVDTGHCQGRTPIEGGERGKNQVPDRREEDRSVERRRR